MYDSHKEFDDAYWKHQPPPVRALRDPGQRTDAAQLQLATDLMAQGYIIDGPIMLWGWGPYNVMFLRRMYGFASVPALNEDPTGLKTGAGSIKVSLDPADYPPIDPPPAPPDHPALGGSYVGSTWGAGVYASLEGDPTANGQKVIKDGIEYQMHRVLSFGGKVARWYTKTTPDAIPEEPQIGPAPANPGDSGGV